MNGSALWLALRNGWWRAPFTLKDDPKKLRRIFNEGMTPEKALRLSSFYAGVRRKSETVGTMPCEVRKPGKRGAKWSVVDYDHSLTDILSLRPNVDFDAVRFWTAVVAALDLNGNAFLEKQYGSDEKTIVGLGWLDPFSFLGDKFDEDSNEFTYFFNDPLTRSRRAVAERDLVHIRQFSLGQRFGVSAIYHGTRALRAATSIETASESTFRNGLRPGGYLTTGGPFLTEPQREQAQKTLIDDMEGEENAGKWKILEGPFTAQPMKLSPEDAEMLSSRRFSIEDVCRFLDIPPILIGHAVEGQTMFGGGVESTLLWWRQLSLRSLVSLIESQLQIALLTPAELKLGVRIRFDMEELLRADSTTRANVHGSLVNDGIETRNEARESFNLPPLDGGDVLTVQSQNIPVADIGKAETAPKPESPFAPPPPPRKRPAAPSAVAH